MTDRTLATMATAIVAGTALAIPAGAAAQGPQPALSVQVQALQGGKRPALARTIAVGTLSPFVPGQQVRVQLARGGRVITRRWATVQPVAGADHGTFRLRSRRLIEPGRYLVRVHKPATPAQAGADAASEPFGLRYPALAQGDHGRAVKLLNRLLRKQRYRAPKGGRFTAATARAVLAFRKVNRMAWARRASPEVLTRLARGRGAFKLRHPAAGRHVEVDLDRQVMALAERGKPQHTFHISSGAPSTPSDRGHFRFYRRLSGYNGSRMLDSVYYNRGEAVHGYRSVPPYPASHGCIRSPVADARFIYDWVQLGMSIHVY
jgi:L,D-transpeptidase-like protein